MTNSIYSKQNDSRMLKCLAAQRKKYNNARKKASIKDYAIAGFALFSLFTSFVNSDVIDAIAFLLLSILSVLKPQIDYDLINLKRTAAEIQNYVDVTLYAYVLDDHSLNWDPLLKDDIVDEYICNINKHEMNDVKNWYSDYSTLPPLRQIFYCQRENIRWDFELRKLYKNMILIGITAIITIMFLATIFINPSMIDFICVVSLAIPLIEFAYKYYNKLNEDIERLNSIREKSNKINDENLCVDDLKVVQYLIDEHRVKSMFIPKKIYNFYRDRFEKTENEIAREITNRK